MASRSMGLIHLHQSTDCCVQPEAIQENFKNLLTARTTVLCYIYQTIFPIHAQKEKGGLAMQDYI